ncbi:aspartate-semialdehyde dehydrogenase [Estrella lausannensis]|uniref:Aspartate-semialdehyde dehydrogenase n=1 Tax=Estrella lausannensis TaxID=483423 RepID=A0A0H5DTM8_9BACT|nr:aspartate-semialdehyde dehydrogenase [Estrella lausannensis]CRX39224.1 Aspartate-semialdehyde dehydrogenase [Estrella lausannensis]
MQKGKIQVGILGATGGVGQRLALMLANHPQFEVVSLVASDRSQGKKYSEAAEWCERKPMPENLAGKVIDPVRFDLPCRVLFSALDAEAAASCESKFRDKGYHVISNARTHRFDADVPLLIPEVNSDHLSLLKGRKEGGSIVTNPNCVVAGLALALKPIHDLFFLEEVHVVTMQAISGAGIQAKKTMNIDDNLIPFISGEEEKIETEPKKILGTLQSGKIIPLEVKIAAQANRVAVSDGHTACVSIKIRKKVYQQELIGAWRTFRSKETEGLPSAPQYPIHYHEEPFFPQPKLHRDLDGGMAVSIGRLRSCSLFDFRFVVLSHNMSRGAAGAAVLNGEMMLKQGYFN